MITRCKLFNYFRNESLLQSGLSAPKAIKTGTTICGMIFDGGVVLGADTRATEGNIVADKNCEKIHFLADNMYCCGAGTAADTEKVTQMISSQLTLQKLNTGREVPVITANRLLKQYLFKYQVSNLIHSCQFVFFYIHHKKCYLSYYLNLPCVIMC